MGIRLLGIACAAFATAAGAPLAAAAPVVATTGSTSGAPSANICAASITCTYVPFAGVAAPSLQVPFDGTVTSFSVSSGSAAGDVELRVLRPAPGGAFTGVATGPAEPLAGGVSTFAVSIPVRAGDLLGVDNNSSALIFEPGNATAIAAYYELPSLANGATAAPNHSQSGLRLLMSATVQQTPAPGPTPAPAPTPAPTPTPTPPTGHSLRPPAISDARLGAVRIRVVGLRPRTVAARRAPAGTVLHLRLSAPASLRVSVGRSTPGLRRAGRCVTPTAALRRAGAARCVRVAALGVVREESAAAGPVRIAITGRLRGRPLAPGAYRLTIRARNAAGTARPVALAFAIVR